MGFFLQIFNTKFLGFFFLQPQIPPIHPHALPAFTYQFANYNIPRNLQLRMGRMMMPHRPTYEVSPYYIYCGFILIIVEDWFSWNFVVKWILKKLNVHWSTIDLNKYVDCMLACQSFVPLNDTLTETVSCIISLSLSLNWFSAFTCIPVFSVQF